MRTFAPVRSILAAVVFLVACGDPASPGPRNATDPPPTAPASAPPPQRACTRDAKVCPDGSTVGRTGPSCEFAPCPTAK